LDDTVELTGAGLAGDESLYEFAAD
jgi:hypothetical protein